MFKYLEDYARVLVTGPQRSGTRICAQMIAHDTGFAYFDEFDVAMDSVLTLMGVLETRSPCVVQCPALCRYVHRIADSDTAVVLLRRPLEEIHRSLKRIRWRWEWLEQARYTDKTGTSSAELKYSFWDSHQRSRIENAIEVEYESLRTHPMWLAPSSREQFQAADTMAFDSKDLPWHSLRPTGSNRASVVRTSGDEGALLIHAPFQLKYLNVTGVRIWELCDGIRTVAEILNELRHDFPDTKKDVLAADVQRFLIELSRNGLLQLHTQM